MHIAVRRSSSHTPQNRPHNASESLTKFERIRRTFESREGLRSRARLVRRAVGIGRRRSPVLAMLHRGFRPTVVTGWFADRVRPPGPERRQRPVRDGFGGRTRATPHVARRGLRNLAGLPAAAVVRLDENRPDQRCERPDSRRSRASAATRSERSDTMSSASPGRPTAGTSRSTRRTSATTARSSSPTATEAVCRPSGPGSRRRGLPRVTAWRSWPPTEGSTRSTRTAAGGGSCTTATARSSMRLPGRRRETGSPSLQRRSSLSWRPTERVSTALRSTTTGSLRSGPPTAR